MKKLSRMLLIHWHNYEKELIEFDMINFLTGKTAAGKSTIIDALQLVLLGDTNGAFFNKAANQKSSRTLKSYLFGEIGDDGDVGFRYMRNDRFSSYVALEFEDTERKLKFTVGIICDCYKDQSFDFKWFMLPKHGFPENLFINETTKVPYDISGLKTFLSRWLGKKKTGFYEFYDTNKRYQEVTLGKFGQIKNKYRILLKKAVPFSPISDIEKFITESICDVKNNIQVEEMQSGIRQYKNLEEDARKTQERIECLREIHCINLEYEKEKEKYRKQKYIVIRAEKEEELEKEREYQGEILKKQEQVKKQTEEISAIEKEIKKLEKEIEKLEHEYYTSNIVQREKELKRQLEEKAARICQIESDIQETLKRINQHGETWMEQLNSIKSTDFQSEELPISLLKEMQSLTKEQLLDFQFLQAAERLSKFKQELNDYKSKLKNQKDELDNKIAQLRITIINLKKGIKPFPKEVLALKSLLEEELALKYKKPVKIFVLANLLEIKNAEWRNAIEGYLDKQKFYLLTDVAYYQDALHIYNRVKREKKIYDVGLIDIEKLRKNFMRKPKLNSLAEEIETEHKDARLYIDYVLGEVIKCEEVSELNQHKISITKNGMLYKGYVSRKINPRRYESPFIGQYSMKLLLEQKSQDLDRQEKLFSQIDKEYGVIERAAKKAVLDDFEAKKHQETVEKGCELEKLKQEKKKIQVEYDELDFLYMDRMKEKIKDYKKKREAKTKEKENLALDNVRLNTQRETLEKEKLPQVLQKLAQIQERLDAEFEKTWMEEQGETCFLEEQAKKDSKTSLSANFYSAMKKTEKNKERLRNTRTEKRYQYNTKYKMPYDINLESNQYFDRELKNLEEIRLPEYIEKICDSKEKAYNQFRDDFIAKIKSNIESVSQQIEELNYSLKQSVFGTDRYRFVKQPRPEYRNYYEMIMDPLLMDTGGWNVASQSFNQKYQKEIDELFQLLILNETNVSAKRREEYEKNIKKFTDYKTYLVFDLIVTNEQGIEQRLSKTLLKKSGGETQIPFYIALLASFSQICRIRNKNQSNTIRVIILDEAFSKMDGERIRESIYLLRRFGLQAIFSAPPEKIPDIAPLVDRNIAVYKDTKHSFTRNFDPKEIEE